MLEVRHKPLDSRVVYMDVPDLGRKEKTVPMSSSSSHTLPSEDKAQSVKSEAVADSSGVPKAGEFDKEANKKKRNNYVVENSVTKPIAVARPVTTMKGHTAFLTFATRPA